VAVVDAVVIVVDLSNCYYYCCCRRRRRRSVGGKVAFSGVFIHAPTLPFQPTPPPPSPNYYETISYLHHKMVAMR